MITHPLTMESPAFYKAKDKNFVIGTTLLSVPESACGNFVIRYYGDRWMARKAYERQKAAFLLGMPAPNCWMEDFTDEFYVSERAMVFEDLPNGYVISDAIYESGKIYHIESLAGLTDKDIRDLVSEGLETTIYRRDEIEKIPQRDIEIYKDYVVSLVTAARASLTYSGRLSWVDTHIWNFGMMPDGRWVRIDWDGQRVDSYVDYMSWEPADNTSDVTKILDKIAGVIRMIDLHDPEKEGEEEDLLEGTLIEKLLDEETQALEDLVNSEED